MHQLSFLNAVMAGNFTQIATQLIAAGVRATLPAPGMLQLQAPTGAPKKLVISVGIHGNETAPIEMMARLIDRLMQSPRSLAIDILIVVGNLKAIACGRRFIDTDLNRLFSADHAASDTTEEAQRADVIMRTSCSFFEESADAKWHLDLHSAIRPSRYPRFAIIPAPSDDPSQHPIIDWLAQATVEAVIFNTCFAATYSAYTAQLPGVLSCTIELGQTGIVNPNEVTSLQAVEDCLMNLLLDELPSSTSQHPVRFRTVQEIIKKDDTFCLAFDHTVQNFTAMKPHSLLASDRTQQLHVGAITEYVVFPNPTVAIGQRAGLMVVMDESS
jgi:succinylglutamate desuccinylase